MIALIPRFCFFQQIRHRAGEGERITMSAAVPEGKKHSEILKELLQALNIYFSLTDL